jgi:hypothetical protein
MSYLLIAGLLLMLPEEGEHDSVRLMDGGELNHVPFYFSSGMVGREGVK